MYQVKPKFMGNPDRGQYITPVRPKTFTAKDLPSLRFQIRNFMGDNNLGAGNWDTAKVYKDGKEYGYMSYNGRIWDKEIWSDKAREIKDEN